MYKIIGADGKEYGPVSADMLRQWIAEGRVDAQTRLLLEGTTEWKPLSAFPEFATAQPPGAPPAMPPAPMAGAAAMAGRNPASGPAIGLMVTAILGALCQAANLVMRSAFQSAFPPNNQLPAWVTKMSGTMGTALGIFAILMSILVFIGALKMKKLENYRLAMAASIIAMIPCVSPCCLIGLPLGIWALVVLSKPEVKSAFH